MKKLFTVLSVALCLGFANAQQTAHAKATAKNQASRPKATMKIATVAKVSPAGVKMKKDGTPDKRYKSAQHLKKDGTPDSQIKDINNKISKH